MNSSKVTRVSWLVLYMAKHGPCKVSSPSLHAALRATFISIGSHPKWGITERVHRLLHKAKEKGLVKNQNKIWSLTVTGSEMATILSKFRLDYHGKASGDKRLTIH